MDTKITERVTNDPYAKLLGMSVDEIAEGFAKVSMDVTDNMLNIHGTANGGVIFSLADAAFAIASNTYEQQAVGINVNMNFIAAGFSNDRLIAVAKEVSKNSKLGFYNMEVRNEHDQLIATADGMVYRKNKINA
ncbi:hydroxyphenylacetyl-CoA thioesterase PaaI [Schinkia azotoformans]|uniref:hydroxyphenylacetyl-CoA thioesterase PaaI n=1 Tax=Schinkia azotoformans TaxID=1454 RepID=UPI002E1BA861|nr:hydroxyphenylacetyl-CoA thioesterase PaaI [Schinkia azotoformans]MED4353182.1 hydroxyphenylacetyl-CoA thioesterase PaaI [Schinkia azotoformans]